MRKLFSCVLLLLFLSATPAMARPNDPGQGRDRFLNRIIRLLKTFIGIQPTGDLPIPPLP